MIHLRNHKRRYRRAAGAAGNVLVLSCCSVLCRLMCRVCRRGESAAIRRFSPSRFFQFVEAVVMSRTALPARRKYGNEYRDELVWQYRLASQV